MFTLYEHNQKAYENMIAMLDEQGKAAIVHPTGTGKSFIVFWLAKEHPDKKICWFAPNEYIFNVQMKNLKKELWKNKENWNVENIEFYTYTWLMWNQDKISELSPDYIVLDEFHRCGAREWEKGVRKMLEYYQETKYIGLSATHIRYLDQQRDMAKELFDGCIASEMSLAEAISRGILPAPKYVVSLYSYQDELLQCQKRVNQLQNKVIKQGSQELINQIRRSITKADGLDRVFQKHIENPHGKYIVFCARVKHLQEMVKKTSEFFGRIDENPHIYKVYCEQKDAIKEFDKFQNDQSEHLKLLFVVDILNEGVHISDVDGIIMMRPTCSPLIYQQQVGRALAAGKKERPLIFDIVNNYESLSSVKDLWYEVKYAEEYDYPDKGENYRVLEQFQIVDETCESREMFEQLYRNLDAGWDYYYEALLIYKEEFGNVYVPKRYETKEGLKLGRWVTRQRENYHEKGLHAMTQERFEKLDALGMVWDKKSDMLFEIGYHELLQYQKEFGQIHVPDGYECRNGYKLGDWLQNVKRSYRNNTLSEERIERLEQLGMIWDVNDYQWNQMFQLAEQYYNQHGNVDISKSYQTANGKQLGAWLFRQRRLLYSKNNCLSEERQNKLRELGLTIKKESDSFEEHFGELKQYYQEHGDIVVPVNYVNLNGFCLGNWVASMRQSYRKGNLSGEQIKRLEELHMVWRIVNRKEKTEVEKESKWMEWYQEAKNYYDKHGNLYIPSDYVSPSHKYLGIWINMQRKIARGQVEQQKMTRKQFDLLSEIGMDWMTPMERKWENAYQHAAYYYEMFGDLDVPGRYQMEDGFVLGKWVSIQKSRYRKKDCRLTEYQIKRLEELDIDW